MSMALVLLLGYCCNMCTALCHVRQITRISLFTHKTNLKGS